MMFSSSRKASGVQNKHLTVIAFIGTIAITYLTLWHNDCSIDSAEHLKNSKTILEKHSYEEIVEEDLYCGENIKVFHSVVKTQKKNDVQSIYCLSRTWM